MKWIMTCFGLWCCLCCWSLPSTKQQIPTETPSVKKAIQKAMPSVVQVVVTKRGNWGEVEVVGAGVVIDNQGNIITAHHVVANAITIVIKDYHNHEYAVNQYGNLWKDSSTVDLSLIRTTAELPAITFGTIPEVGDVAITIGHPFGYSNTVCVGIISGLDRKLEIPGSHLNAMIQTDAAVNPGNSGGPLLNIKGELIGINLAMREGSNGLGFATNIDTIRKFLGDQR